MAGQWSRIILLFLLSTFGLANVWPRQDGFDIHVRGSPTIEIRQASASASPLCYTPCDPVSCGSGDNWCTPEGGTGSSSDVAARSFISDFNDSSFYDQAIHGVHVGLVKRAFTYDPRWNVGKVSSYLSQQMQNVGAGGAMTIPPADPQFTSNVGFFAGGINQRTVSTQQTFGTGTLQLGTGGLHGCTMMCIVSKRAVYMAHYWESYTTDNNDVVTGADLTRWQDRVLNTISGAATPDPFDGPSINWALFNQKGDNTAVYFMTPFKPGVNANPVGSGPNPITDMKYQNKIQLVINLVTQNIPGVRAEIRGYTRLNYSYNRQKKQYEGPDAHLIDTTERGICLFQYDGASNWRLFYEAKKWP